MTVSYLSEMPICLSLSYFIVAAKVGGLGYHVLSTPLIFPAASYTIQDSGSKVVVKTTQDSLSPLLDYFLAKQLLGLPKLSQ